MDLVGGGVDSRGGYVSKIFVCQNERIGTLRGGARRARPPLDPPMIHKKLIRMYEQFSNYNFYYNCIITIVISIPIVVTLV